MDGLVVARVLLIILVVGVLVDYIVVKNVFEGIAERGPARRAKTADRDDDVDPTENPRNDLAGPPTQ